MKKDTAKPEILDIMPANHEPSNLEPANHEPSKIEPSKLEKANDEAANDETTNDEESNDEISNIEPSETTNIVSSNNDTENLVPLDFNSNPLESNKGEMLVIKERIKHLIEIIDTDLYERREHVALVLLCALSGLNVFLLGPPGTAKSIIARRIGSIFCEKTNYFEYLMQKFSTYDDIFGPVSIAQIKKDKYVRKTEGFLPEADFAFLDEIWKAGPPILNSLLTIINEKTFRNGTESFNVPLKSLISASNETPQDLELTAIYDRFIVRVHIPPLMNVENFNKLLSQKNISSSLDCGVDAITTKQMLEWRAQIQDVELSEESLLIIDKIREDLNLNSRSIINEIKKKGDVDDFEVEDDDIEEDDCINRPKIYISDRRWKLAAYLLKSSAFFSGRVKTNTTDCLLLSYCLWSEEDDIEYVEAVVRNAVGEFYTDNLEVNELTEKREKLSKKLASQKKFHEKTVLKTEMILDDECYVINFQDKDVFYIRKRDTNENMLARINPIDKNGNVLDKVNVLTNFLNNEDELTRSNKNSSKGKSPLNSRTVEPVVLHYKGDRIPFDKKFRDKMNAEVKEVQDETKALLTKLEDERERMASETCNSFINYDKMDIAFGGIDEQILTMKKELKNCAFLDSQLNELFKDEVDSDEEETTDEIFPLNQDLGESLSESFRDDEDLPRKNNIQIQS